MLAEHDAAERQSLRDFLLGLDYSVLETETGAEALEKIREMEPDIIIADLDLVGIGGIELLKIAKEESWHIPFILISGSGTMDDVIRGLRLGAWDYLSKPISPIELLQHSLDRVREKVDVLRNLYRQQEHLEELVHRRTLDLLTQNRNYQEEIERRQRMEKQARKAEDEWRRTVDALPEMIAIIDKDRNIIRINKALLSFLGKTEQEVIGSACLMCSDEHACLHRETLKDSKPRTTELYLGNEKRHLELTILPYASSDGEALGSVHILRDITEHKRREKQKELRQSQALHSQKLESVGQLASGIAHEINTPTQFVSSNIAFFEEAFGDIATFIADLQKASSHGAVSSEKIQSGLEESDWQYLQEEIPSALQQSREGLNRVTSIVRAMKEFSHPGSKDSQEVDINNLIEVTVTVARNEWKYVADMELDLHPAIPKIPCLADEMGQVILNLLVNAAQAIEEKLGVTPEREKGLIRIETFSDLPWLVIRISDTGKGIPPHLKDKIFDPFFTTKSVGKGTGQGLAIAYSVVTDKHGGNIRVTSTPEKGTTFTIELPLTA